MSTKFSLRVVSLLLTAALLLALAAPALAHPPMKGSTTVRDGESLTLVQWAGNTSLGQTTLTVKKIPVLWSYRCSWEFTSPTLTGYQGITITSTRRAYGRCYVNVSWNDNWIR